MARPKNAAGTTLTTGTGSRNGPRTATASRTAPPIAAPSHSVDVETRLPLLTRRKPFAWLLLITGVVAWLASGALVLDRLELYKNPNAVTSCDVNPWISCGKVMATHQAELFGFPNPLIGVFAFAVIITTAMVLFAGARMNRSYWIGLQTGVTLGMIMIAWLWSQALYAIGILCPYCMVVWAMMIPLFVWTTVRNVQHGVIPASAGVRRFLADWAWVIIGLLYLGVAASIFFRFVNLFVGGGAG
ncbi:vitamin K epoxide reductase family protein [Paenarthrobacter sp. PH39-S1]|uniref:vitamin K epoxide reductase family protein n=1 Tax=Paenarthrobacter sp. PH39-S1 TaxID=3046204 RepID=UPI0024BBD299|nr:vitamin K epoxide reductase family protein [Paenarthrobacter sp. PH39-S1]MDJ0355396.1 vitamin K epoxide reductase family protein [Paenarthrobacter sp. PH39-S1]